MDVPQLKLLAGNLRGLLDQRGVPVVHGHALDLIAALPGLRNWPEVMAFPDRVAACRLEPATAGRLAFRLLKRYQLQLSPEELVRALNPPDSSGVDRPRQVPQVWPGGPAPGVYITTSPEAITALLHAYEEATDGELVYAEAAASHWQGAIDLGDSGLWSSGMDRVPSGTLLVLGPLVLTQRDWDQSASKLEMACLRALGSGHRVVILVDTPTPELMYVDIETMVLGAQPEGEDYETALMGRVTQAGELEPMVPFAAAVSPPRAAPCAPDLGGLPPAVVPLIQRAVAERPRGLLACASEVIQEHRGIEVVNAVLPLTDHLGPAARIKVRDRGTPAKDWMVPDAVKALPMLPSIQSAYAHGFRRMVVDPYYLDEEVLLKYADEVLFLANCRSFGASEVFFDSVRDHSHAGLGAGLAKVVALLSVNRIDTRQGPFLLPDLYLPAQAALEGRSSFEQVREHIDANRTVRWEDALEHALRTRRVTPSGVRKVFPRNEDVKALLSRFSGT